MFYLMCPLAASVAALKSPNIRFFFAPSRPFSSQSNQRRFRSYQMYSHSSATRHRCTTALHSVLKQGQPSQIPAILRSLSSQQSDFCHTGSSSIRNIEKHLQQRTDFLTVTHYFCTSISVFDFCIFYCEKG